MITQDNSLRPKSSKTFWPSALIYAEKGCFERGAEQGASVTRPLKGETTSLSNNEAKFGTPT